MAIQARPARNSDIKPLAQALSRAFYDDPVSVWMLPDDERRREQLATFFGAVTRYHHLPNGGVLVAGDEGRIGAAALWDPPGTWQQSRLTQLRLMLALALPFGRRLSAAAAIGELLVANHPDEPHWYLAVIGSDPAVRGRGFGQAVMAPQLQRCDEQHCAAYLESSKAENVPYYERFGFEVIGEFHLPDGGPTLWRMLRRPQ